MINKNKKIKDNRNRPIVLIANSSTYLYHYRKLLIKNLSKHKINVIAVSPTDKDTKLLSKYCVHIPWRINRQYDSNIFSFFIALLRLFFIIRTLKPRLIHSHNMKVNLLSSIISAILNIKLIISITGLGRLSTSKNYFSRLFIDVILKLIFLISLINKNYKTNNRMERRVKIILQNKNDLIKLQNSILFDNASHNFLIIPGSGLPKKYMRKKKETLNEWFKNENYLEVGDQNSITIIFCGRLLKQKGIEKFVSLLDYKPNLKAEVFGDVDNHSKDSVSKTWIANIKSKYYAVTFHNHIKYPLIKRKFSYPILLILSNYGEGFPRSLIEAISQNIPVVCSKHASNCIENKDIIYIAKDDSCEAYLEQIEKIKEDHKNKLLKTKLTKSREYVFKNFLESKIVDNTIDYYF